MAQPRWRRMVVPACLMLAAVAAISIDGPFARACAQTKLPGDLRRLLTWSEMFGHGLGAMVVLLIVFLLDPRRRPMLLRAATAALGAGMVANLVKGMVARTRPHAFDLAASATESFHGWWPMGAGGSTEQSFPSAHTATAVGLAMALAWLYPRGRGLFAVLAVLVACQRIECGAHFLSDTLAGASVGWFVAMGMMPGGLLVWGFDWFEARCRSADRRDGCEADRPTSAERLGAWLFRHRGHSLAPLALLVVGVAVYVSTAPPAPWDNPMRLAAVAMLAAAAAIRFHVSGHARRGTSSRGVTFEAGALMTTGTYAIVRNPLYVANVLIWCGIAAMTGSLPLVVLTAVVTGLQYHFIIAAEERYLTGRYGQQYAEYRHGAARWIPRWPARGPIPGAAPPTVFIWRRGLFREADTLFLLTLGAWFIAGVSQGWTPWHAGAAVPGGWYTLPVWPAIAWAIVKVLKKSAWRRERRAAA